MTVKRTPRIKEAMVNALLTAMEYLNHPDMPKLPNARFEPKELARFLDTCCNLIEAPGRLQEKKYVLDDIQLAADYLNNPAVTKIPFAVRSSNIARMLREAIRDLK
jgi:hypothetical protein